VGYSVQEKAEHVGTFRWIEARLMRILASWVPTTPEMEVKVLFGRHVWDCARHADAFGKRAFELRAPMQYSLPPTQPFQDYLEDLARLESAADRIAGFYDVACPALDARFRHYRETTDPLMDEPTVRLLEAASADLARMGAERCRLAAGLGLGVATVDAPRWLAREAGIASIVAHGDANARARGVRTGA
jgi:hypothetical protein